ncbi:MAG: carboxypeptidase-like regulatory domain-containing protein [Bacteroidota bacterium]|nr:carboxypeptidase-like regulatory domain-containing protein [Bacteroidota bacterium]
MKHQFIPIISLLIAGCAISLAQVRPVNASTPPINATTAVNATIVNPSAIDSTKGASSKTDTVAIDTLLAIADSSRQPLSSSSLDSVSNVNTADSMIPEQASTTAKTPSKPRYSTILSTPVVRTAPFTLSGHITDAETGESAPFATVRVEKLGLGTVTNADGDWTLRLPVSAAREPVSFKYVGYITQTYNISKLPDHSIIRLRQSNFELSQVVVTPDKKFEILRAAWKAIPQNYPVKPTLTKGFYRETERVNDTLFLYFNEAILNVYKNTYRNDQNFGQIEVEKSRKNVFPGIDSINDVRFYGGPHFPNDLDIVFSRWDFMKPSDFKNWYYDLEGMYKDSLSEVYTISFRHKVNPNTNFQGRMFIDANSYAYIGFELKRMGIDYLDPEDISTSVNYISGTTTIKIGYTEKDGRQFLNHINYKTSGYNTASKKRIFKDIEYITTNIQTDSVRSIPFDRQFDYTDILSIKADNYDQTYWKDYNILQESKVMNAQTNLLYNQEKAVEQLTKVYNTQLTEQEKILLFLKRFTFEGGFTYHPVRYVGGSHLIGYGTDPLQTSQTGKNVTSNYFAISTLDGVRFELTKKWSVFGTISTALYGMDQIQSDLGLNYRMCIFPSGRWIFLDLGLGASLATTKMPLCDIDNTAGLSIDGKKLNSNTLAVNAGNFAFGPKGVVGLSVRMGKKYELFGEGNYLLPILNHDYVQFKETKGFFLSRKSAKVDWDDPNLYFWIKEKNSENFQRMTSPHFEIEPYYFRIGIRSGF